MDFVQRTKSGTVVECTFETIANLDAKRPVQLHVLGIATATPGFTAVIRAGDALGLFPETVSSSQTVSSGTQFTITGGKHRYYLIWITSLPPGGSTVRINEVRAA